MVRKNNIICPYCHKDTGIPQVLHMVIPEGGLACPHCKKIVVQSNNVIWGGNESSIINPRW